MCTVDSFQTEDRGLCSVDNIGIVAVWFEGICSSLFRHLFGRSFADFFMSLKTS